MNSALFKRSNGTYYVSFQDGHRRRWKSTGTKNRRQAMAFLLEFDGEQVSSNQETTLEKFSESVLAHIQTTSSRKTLEIYRRAFRQFIEITGNKQLALVTAFDADRFKVSRMDQVAPASVNIDLRALRAAFNLGGYAWSW